MLLGWCVASCVAQRVPSWMNELPTPGNDTYLYVRESGEGVSVDAAQNQAMARVMQTTANRIGQPFDARSVNDYLNNGTSFDVISRQFNVPINKVAQYDIKLGNGNYRVYVLCQVARTGNIVPVWETLRRTGESNNWTALAKSAVIPGLGQMGKGRYGAGIATLVGEISLIGVGVGSYLLAQDRLGVIRSSQVSYPDFVNARQSYNTLFAVNRAAWCAAGVLYVYNLVRAFTIQPRGANTLSLAPSILIMPDAATPFFGMVYNF